MKRFDFEVAVPLVLEFFKTMGIEGRIPLIAAGGINCHADIARLQALGVQPARIVWDSGVGFGKTVEHNLTLLAHIDDLVEISQAHQAGVLIGTSRKRFLENLGCTPLAVEQRLEGSLASATWAMLCGANMVRVHDVKAVVQARELLVRPLGEVSP